MRRPDVEHDVSYPRDRAFEVVAGLLLFSVHGPNAKVHGMNVGVLEAFDQTCEGIRNAVDEPAWRASVYPEPDFVTLTLISNSAQVVLVPFIAGGLWWITASARYIGDEQFDPKILPTRVDAWRATHEELAMAWQRQWQPGQDDCRCA